MIKDDLKKLINLALKKLCILEKIDYKEFDFSVEVPPKNIKADYATNVCLIGAKFFKKSPKILAESLKNILLSDDFINFKKEFKIFIDIKSITVLGQGFLNFDLALSSFIYNFLFFYNNKQYYFFNNNDKLKNILLEFVSANPTGPLHIGHARGAVLGDSLARLLKKKGHKVETEYYVNNAGNQMNILSKSLEIRYRQVLGEKIDFPENHYMGEYITDIARALYEEKKIEDYKQIDFKTIILDKMLDIIKSELKRFNVEIDNWFYETKILERDSLGVNDLDRVMKILEDKNLIKDIDGAKWLNTTEFSEDDKDRVIIRHDGRPTYFASDIAYHENKYLRNYDLMIDIWGADHHGYVPRIKASMEYLGNDKEKLNIILYQLVSLIRDGEKVAMSTRKGEFISLVEVLDEVGMDATRFFLLMRSSDNPIEFDLSLAKKATNENPVFYIEYAHARIHSIIKNFYSEFPSYNEFSFDKIEEKYFSILEENLGEEEDISIIKTLISFKEILNFSEKDFAPHHITTYLLDLAGKFHNYYNKYKIIDKTNQNKTFSRVVLIKEIAFVIKNGLEILGIEAPESM